MCDHFQINPIHFQKFSFGVAQGSHSKFYYKDFNETNISLCRYTRIENLYDLMKGKQRVYIRGSFPDSYERGEFSIPLRFYINPKDTQEYKDKSVRIKKQIEASNLIPAMCLTKYDKWDDYFFWKVYAKEINGICIIFKLKNLIHSLLNNDNIDFFMSKMTYKDISVDQNYEDILFAKTPPYKQEKEYRIYLQSKDKSPITYSDFCYINIDFNLLDPDIILSPFSDYSTLKGELIEKYPELNNRIVKSKIINKTNLL